MVRKERSLVCVKYGLVHVVSMSLLCSLEVRNYMFHLSELEPHSAFSFLKTSVDLDNFISLFIFQTVSLMLE